MSTQLIVAQDVTIIWHNAAELTISGQAFDQTENRYSRLPERYRSDVRPAVWELSGHSAGLAVAFSSDATHLRVRWQVRHDTKFSHMTAIGIKGLDLYLKDDQSRWRWAATARPSGVSSEYRLLTHTERRFRDYLLYLPLYDGIESLMIGVDSSAIVRPGPLPFGKAKPLVFYGTSITQGCSASRPGMTYPAIIGRQLMRETLNFGFSGNGRMEMALASIIGTIPAEIYIIDCLPNCTPDEVKQNSLPFVKELRRLNPAARIILVENIPYADEWYDPAKASLCKAKNAYLKEAYDQLRKEGFRNLYYLERNSLIGQDDEATIDGAHLTDIGMQRLADALLKKIKPLLKSH